MANGGRTSLKDLDTPDLVSVVKDLIFVVGFLATLVGWGITLGTTKADIRQNTQRGESNRAAVAQIQDELKDINKSLAGQQVTLQMQQSELSRIRDILDRRLPLFQNGSKPRSD